MATKQNVIVTSSAEGKVAYGITTETEENVFIPVSIADAVGLEEFDIVEAILVRNDRPEPPLKAIKVRSLEPGPQD